MTQDNQDPEDDEAVEETAPVAPQGPQKYRVDRDGYVDVGGGKDRVYVGKSLAGALVTISDSP